MQKVFIAIIMIITSICNADAQNFRRTVTRDTLVSLERQRDMMYEITQYFESGVQVAPGVYGENVKTSQRLLYRIPEHLKGFYTEDIDSIMHDKSMKALTWSWFMIWDTTYTKDGVVRTVSFTSLLNIIYACIGCYVLMIVGSFLFGRKDQRMSLNDFIDMFEENVIAPVLGGAYGLFGAMISVFSRGSDIHTSSMIIFGFIPYGILLGYILYLLTRIYRKYNTKAEQEN